MFFNSLVLVSAIILVSFLMLINLLLPFSSLMQVTCDVCRLADTYDFFGLRPRLVFVLLLWLVVCLWWSWSTEEVRAWQGWLSCCQAQPPPTRQSTFRLCLQRKGPSHLPRHHLEAMSAILFVLLLKLLRLLAGTFFTTCTLISPCFKNNFTGSELSRGDSVLVPIDDDHVVALGRLSPLLLFHFISLLFRLNHLHFIAVFVLLFSTFSVAIFIAIAWS